MNKRAAYLTQILEKIGIPLMASVSAPSPVADAQKAAQTLASLLSATVALSIELGKVSGLDKAEHNGDDIRVTLASIASPLIAEHYQKHGEAPDEATITKIAKGLEPTISFAENFTDHEKVVQALEQSGLSPAQSTIRYLNGFVPVINAVAAFPFGQPEAKLITEIASRLSMQADKLHSSITDNSSAASPESRQAVLDALARLYTACHLAETQRLSTAGEDTSGGLDTVWKDFDTRVAMVNALLNGLGEEESKTSPSASSPPPVTTPKTTQYSPQTEQSTSASPTDSEPPSPQESERGETKGDGNPMAIFAAPKDKTGNTDTGTGADTEETGESGEKTAETPPASPSSPSPQEQQGDTPEKQEKSGASGNPMSFFKSPPKADESDDDD